MLVGKHGTLLRALTQMDPWTVCCLTDGICSGGEGVENYKAEGPRVSIVFIPALIHARNLPQRDPA